jgi:hypothetical protein
VIFDIALACVSAGGLMIVFAFFAHTLDTEAAIRKAVKELTATVKSAAERRAGAVDTGAGQAEREAISAIKDFLDGLAGVADKLSKLTPAVAALVVATILFALAAALAGIHELH